MGFASECLEIAPSCEERMLGREGLPLLGEAGIFLTGLSRLRDHYLIRRNRPEFHILMVSHDEGGVLLTGATEQPIPAGALVFLPAAVPGGLRLVGERWQTSWILLDDIPRWRHLHRLGHRIWQGEEGEQLYHLLSLMQGEGVRSPLQPQLLSLLLALLDRTLQGEVRGTPELRLQALFRGWRHASTSPGAWRCSPARWPALYPICTASAGSCSAWAPWPGSPSCG